MLSWILKTASVPCTVRWDRVLWGEQPSTAHSSGICHHFMCTTPPVSRWLIAGALQWISVQFEGTLQMGKYLCSYPSAGHCGQHLPVEEPKFPWSYTSVKLVVVAGDKAALCSYRLAAVCWTVMLTEVVPLSQGKWWLWILTFPFEIVPWPFWCPWWKFVTVCSQSCGIIFDRSQVAATSQVVTWDKSWDSSWV